MFANSIRKIIVDDYIREGIKADRLEMKILKININIALIGHKT